MALEFGVVGMFNVQYDVIIIVILEFSKEIQRRIQKSNSHNPFSSSQILYYNKYLERPQLKSKGTRSIVNEFGQVKKGAEKGLPGI
jgi:hypothetical protein